MRGVLRVALPVFLTLSLHAADFVVTNTNADGEGSLAAAVRAANLKPGSRVLFGLEGTPPFTIELNAPLKIGARMTIGGESQPGYTGTPLVTIVNKLTTPAIEITAARSSVRGLAFQLSEGGAFDVHADNVNIYNCTFTRSGAPHAHEQPAIRGTGSYLSFASNRVAFGSPCIAVDGGTRNLIDRNQLDGCYASAVTVANAHDYAVMDNVIGASVIPGSPAIALGDESKLNYVARNRITGFDGGIDIRGNSSWVSENDVREASAFGIRVDGGANNRLTQNMLAGTNAIVLVNQGNHAARAPRLHNVVVSGSETTITGNLNGSSAYEIELYASDECGGARRFAGNSFTSDLNFTFKIPAITPGSRVTATAIDGTTGDTTPFSNCVTASGSPSVPAPVLQSFKAEGQPGDSIEISGTNIHPNARVFFGANEGTLERYAVTPRARVPEGSGTVDVTVRNPDLREAVVRNAFTYREPCFVYINRTANDVSIERGQSATLRVLANSVSTPLTYQWYIGRYPNRGVPVAGATSASLTVTPDVTTTYWVEIKNPCGRFNFSDATVSLPRRRASAH